MSLIELIAGVEAREQTLTVVSEDPAIREELAERLADRNLTVAASTLEEGPDGFAILSENGDVLTVVTLDDLLAADGETDPAFVDGTFERITDHLDETLFTSYSKREMTACSREFEDRAYRRGRGELHTGFQTLDVLVDETETYNALGSAPDLDVQAYAAPEGGDPDAENFTVNVERSSEIRETWFVAYDGDGADVDKCALLAENRGNENYYGFWTYDPATVDSIVDHLNEAYGAVESGDDASGVPDA